MTESLGNLLESAARLSGTTKITSSNEATPDLEHVLLKRLHAARDALGQDENAPSWTETLGGTPQKQTSLYALYIIESTQHILSSPSAPLVGTRHIAQLKTLVAIVFKWAIEDQVASLWSLANVPSNAPPSLPHDASIGYLASLVSRILRLIFPAPISSEPVASTSAQGASESSVSQTHITQSLITRHVTDLLRPSVYLGWYNRSVLPTDAALRENLDFIRSSTIRLLNFIPSSQAISSLGIIMSPSAIFLSPPISHRKACSFILSRQLMRPDGVRGLLSSLFGDEDGVDEAPLARLEHVSTILTTPPHNIPAQEYFKIIIPRLLVIISPPTSASPSSPASQIPNSHKRAVSFAISRLLISSSPTNHSPASSILLPLLHAPFLEETHRNGFESTAAPGASGSIALLTTLLLNTDPSPPLISALLTPIIPPLYTLRAFLAAHPGVILTSEFGTRGLREFVDGLLKTWARVVDASEVEAGLWNVVRGTHGWGLVSQSQPELIGREWRVVEGQLLVVPAVQSTMSALSMESLLPGPGDNPSSALDLRPDPVQFVQFVKSIDRKDISGALFVRVLETYSALRQAGAEPLRTMLHLNIVLEMVEQLGSKILTEVEHILSFIAHALRPVSAAGRQRSSVRAPGSTGIRIEDLKITNADSDDEDEAEELNEDEEAGADDMIFTSLNLLLSILENDPELTPTTTPLLQVIASHLEPLTNSPSNSIRRPAIEARLIIITRQAAGATSGPSKKKTVQATNEEKYQEALRLVQDSVLPVRAHGLLMLRQLVLPPSLPYMDDPSALTEPLDPAYVPAILDIFMQSVQDDDSFIFLNAVQGLAAMVDRLGKDVLSRLVGVYCKGVGGGGTMSKSELDKRLRIGEALGQVVRKCGEALSLYVNVLVPPCLQVFRSTYIPTTLRASALSILALCAETSPLAILSWSDELVSGLIDLVQLETVPFQTTLPTSLATNMDETQHPPTPTVAGLAYEDGVPVLSTSSKIPAFRRSALHFLALVLRASIMEVYKGKTGGFDRSLMGRLGTVTRYMRATDQDGIVRVQAGECVELLEQLIEARLGA